MVKQNFLSVSLKKNLWVLGSLILSAVLIFILLNFFPNSEKAVLSVLLPGVGVSEILVSFFVSSVDGLGGYFEAIFLTFLIQLVYVYLLVSSVFYFKDRDVKKMALSVFAIILTFFSFSFGIYVLKDLKNKSYENAFTQTEKEILKKIVVTPVSEEHIRTKGGAVLGEKFVYTVLLPEGVEELNEIGNRSSVMFFGLPSVQVLDGQGATSPLFSGWVRRITKDGVIVEERDIPGPGLYTIENALVMPGIDSIQGDFCKTSSFKEGVLPLDVDVSPVFVTIFTIRIGYNFNYLENYKLSNQFSAKEIYENTKKLKTCPEEH